MKKTIISIISEWGKTYGHGHLQRMAGLVNFLNSKQSIDSFIISKNNPPDPFQDFIIPEIKDETSLIIRDMRDSSEEEIEALKKHAKVLVIDDNGKGKKNADFAIDLLPVPGKNGNYMPECFLYGYNFIQSINNIKEKTIEKSIDLAIYPGMSPDETLINRIISSLPETTRIVVLKGNNSLPEAIISSKVLLTHFGITLYEGDLCGCRIITINPTDYHSELTELIKNELNIINLGILDGLDIEKSIKIINQAIDRPRSMNIELIKIKKIINCRMENFYNYLSSHNML